jgi:ferric-dicitrate binding protein FerR (iron transport regulator)
MRSDETMQDLIAKYVSGEASPEEAIEIETWAEERPANKTYLEDCFRIYQSSDDAFNMQAKAQLWKNIEAKIIPVPKASTTTKRLWAVGIAASILLVATTTFLLTDQSKRSSFPLVYTATTDTKNVLLSDGTEITLGRSSKVVLKENYGDASRNLTLQGSASFFVRYNESKPFVVAIDGLNIKDAGTRFVVTDMPESAQIKVEVQEGAVLLANSMGQSLTLQTGEAAVYYRPSGSLEAVQTNKTNAPLVDGKEKLLIEGPKKDSAITHKQSLGDTIKTNGDSLLILSTAEAERILGGPVHLTNNDKNKNDGMLKLIRQYRLTSDASIILFWDLEYFEGEDAAHRAYERYRVKYPSGKDAPTLKVAAAEAFEAAEGSTYYLVVLRKQNILLQARINKPKSSVSTQTLLQILKGKSLGIK